MNEVVKPLAKWKPYYVKETADLTLMKANLWNEESRKLHKAQKRTKETCRKIMKRKPGYEDDHKIDVS